MLLVFGIFLAALAFGLNLLLARTPSGGGGGGFGVTKNVQVVVATKDILSAQQITGDMVTIQMFSTDQAAPFSFSDKTRVIGKYSAIFIHANEAITDNLLVTDQSGVVAAKQAYLAIPTGYVGMQIPTGELVGAGGYIQPDDRIDIIVTLGLTTKTAFTNLHVLRVGPAGGANTRGESSSLTVLVTLKQAEDLKFLLDNTNYKYVLESVKDYDVPPPDDPGTTLGSFKATYHIA